MERLENGYPCRRRGVMRKNFIRLAVLWLGIVLPFALFFIAMPKKKPRLGKIPEKPFVVVIPSYNNTKYCEQNLLSVLGQEYTNFRVIYLEDASTDEICSISHNLLQSLG